MARDKGPRDDRWYLNIMAPNTKGEKFAWLDPTSIYINGEAFHDLLDDLIADLEGVECDVVAGLDAMGFVLGAGLATQGLEAQGDGLQGLVVAGLDRTDGDFETRGDAFRTAVLALPCDDRTVHTGQEAA